MWKLFPGSMRRCDPRPTTISRGKCFALRGTGPEVVTKSGLMVGMGEEQEEVLSVLRDLREVGVRAVTLGQYLPPTRAHAPLVEYVPPEVFEGYAQEGARVGVFPRDEWTLGAEFVPCSGARARIVLGRGEKQAHGLGKPAPVTGSNDLNATNSQTTALCGDIARPDRRRYVLPLYWPSPNASARNGGATVGERDGPQGRPWAGSRCTAGGRYCDDLTLTKPDGTRLLTAPEVIVIFQQDRLPLSAAALRSIAEIRLVRPRAHVTREKSGQFDISSLWRRRTKGPRSRVGSRSRTGWSPTKTNPWETRPPWSR